MNLSFIELQVKYSLLVIAIRAVGTEDESIVEEAQREVEIQRSHDIEAYNDNIGDVRYSKEGGFYTI